MRGRWSVLPWSLCLLAPLAGCRIDLPTYVEDDELADAEPIDALPNDAVPIDADLTPPRVISMIPASDATGVEPTLVIEATFSEDVDPATLNASSFVVTHDGSAVVGSITYDSDARRVEFTPSLRLHLLEPYQASISAAVTNLAGTPMAADHVWSFSVREGAWGTVALVETDDAGNAQYPRVASDAAGNAVAVWHQSNGSQNSVRANRRLDVSGWGTATPVETNTVADPPYPSAQIDVSPSGEAIAVWFNFAGTPMNAWANRFVPGTGWGTATLIETDDTGDVSSPRIAIGASGNAVAVWAQSDGTRTNIWANRYIAGAGWSSATLVESDNTGGALNPDVAIDALGNALVVWQQSNASARSSVWANRYAIGTGWGVAAKIETDDTGNATDAKIACAPDGAATAVWHQYDGTRNNIMANRFTTLGGWQTAIAIETDNGAAVFPQVSMDDAGNAIAIWRQHDGTRDNIWLNRFTGAAWDVATVIEADNGTAGSPQVAFDANRNALATWTQSDGTRQNIWVNRYLDGAGWGAAALIETENAADATVPALAVSPMGTAIVVWQYFDGTRRHIRSSAFR